MWSDGTSNSSSERYFSKPPYPGMCNGDSNICKGKVIIKWNNEIHKTHNKVAYYKVLWTNIWSNYMLIVVPKLESIVGITEMGVSVHF